MSATTGDRALRIKVWQDGLPEEQAVTRPGDVVTAVVRLHVPIRRWWRRSVQTIEHRVYFVVEGVD